VQCTRAQRCGGPKICPTLFFKVFWGRGGPFGILARGPTATLLRHWPEVNAHASTLYNCRVCWSVCGWTVDGRRECSVIRPASRRADAGETLSTPAATQAVLTSAQCPFTSPQVSSRYRTYASCFASNRGPSELRVRNDFRFWGKHVSVTIATSLERSATNVR